MTRCSPAATTASLEPCRELFALPAPSATMIDTPSGPDVVIHEKVIIAKRADVLVRTTSSAGRCDPEAEPLDQFAVRVVLEVGVVCRRIDLLPKTAGVRVDGQESLAPVHSAVLRFPADREIVIAVDCRNAAHFRRLWIEG